MKRPETGNTVYWVVYAYYLEKKLEYLKKSHHCAMIALDEVGMERYKMKMIKK